MTRIDSFDFTTPTNYHPFSFICSWWTVSGAWILKAAIKYWHQSWSLFIFDDSQFISSSIIIWLFNVGFLLLFRRYCRGCCCCFGCYRPLQMNVLGARFRDYLPHTYTYTHVPMQTQNTISWQKRHCSTKMLNEFITIAARRCIFCKRWSKDERDDSYADVLYTEHWNNTKY